MFILHSRGLRRGFYLYVFFIIDTTDKSCCFKKLFFLSILDAQRLVKIASEAVIVPKASVGVVNVHALPQAENVIQMFAGIAGSGEYMTIDLDLFGLPVSRCL